MVSARRHRGYSLGVLWSMNGNAGERKRMEACPGSAVRGWRRHRAERDNRSAAVFGGRLGAVAGLVLRLRLGTIWRCGEVAQRHYRLDLRGRRKRQQDLMMLQDPYDLGIPFGVNPADNDTVLVAWSKGAASRKSQAQVSGARQLRRKLQAHPSMLLVPDSPRSEAAEGTLHLAKSLPACAMEAASHEFLGDIQWRMSRETDCASWVSWVSILGRARSEKGLAYAGPPAANVSKFCPICLICSKPKCQLGHGVCKTEGSTQVCAHNFIFLIVMFFQFANKAVKLTEQPASIVCVRLALTCRSLLETWLACFLGPCHSLAGGRLCSNAKATCPVVSMTEIAHANSGMCSKTQKKSYPSQLPWPAGKAQAEPASEDVHDWQRSLDDTASAEIFSVPGQAYTITPAPAGPTQHNFYCKGSPEVTLAQASSLDKWGKRTGRESGDVETSFRMAGVSCNGDVVGRLRIAEQGVAAAPRLPWEAFQEHAGGQACPGMADACKMKARQLTDEDQEGISGHSKCRTNSNLVSGQLGLSTTSAAMDLLAVTSSAQAMARPDGHSGSSFCEPADSQGLAVPLSSPPGRPIVSVHEQQHLQSLWSTSLPGSALLTNSQDSCSSYLASTVASPRHGQSMTSVSSCFCLASQALTAFNHKHRHVSTDASGSDSCVAALSKSSDAPSTPSQRANPEHLHRPPPRLSNEQCQEPLSAYDMTSSSRLLMPASSWSAQCQLTNAHSVCVQVDIPARTPDLVARSSQREFRSPHVSAAVARARARMRIQAPLPFTGSSAVSTSALPCSSPSAQSTAVANPANPQPGPGPESTPHVHVDELTSQTSQTGLSSIRAGPPDQESDSTASVSKVSSVLPIEGYVLLHHGLATCSQRPAFICAKHCPFSATPGQPSNVAGHCAHVIQGISTDGSAQLSQGQEPRFPCGQYLLDADGLRASNSQSSTGSPKTVQVRSNIMCRQK